MLESFEPTSTMRNASIVSTLGIVVCCGCPAAHAAAHAPTDAVAVVVAPADGQASGSARPAPASWSAEPTTGAAVSVHLDLQPASSRLRVALAAPEGDAAAALPLAADPAAVPAAAGDADRIRSLEANLAQLQKDLQSTHERVAELEGRLRQSGGEPLASPLVLALVGLSMLCGFLGKALWNRRRLPLRPSVPATSPPAPTQRSSPAPLGPIGASAAADPPPAAPADRPARVTAADAAAPPRGQPFGEPAPALAPALAPAAAALRSAPAHDPRRVDAGDSTTALMGLDPDPRDRGSGPAAAHPAVPHAVPTGDSEGEGEGEGEGERALDEWIDLEQQAEFFVVLGQDQTAIDLLDAHIRERGDNPLPYLKLLEINQRRSDPVAYERTREAFNARFHAQAPEWSAATGAGRGLDDYAQTLARLQAVWFDPMQAVQLLEGMLFRHDSSVEVFEFAAYRDLLFLHSIARDLAGDRASSSREVDLLLPLDDTGPVVIAEASTGAATATGAASTLVSAAASTEPVAEHAPSVRMPAATAERDAGASSDTRSVPLDLDISRWPAGESGSSPPQQTNAPGPDGRRVG